MMASELRHEKLKAQIGFYDSELSMSHFDHQMQDMEPHAGEVFHPPAGIAWKGFLDKSSPSSSKSMAESSADLYRATDFHKPVGFTPGFSNHSESLVIAPVESAWLENRMLMDDSSLRFMDRHSQGLSLSLCPDRPSHIGIQSFELRDQSNHHPQIPSSSFQDGFSGKIWDFRARPELLQEEHHLRNSKYLSPAQQLLTEFCSLGAVQNENGNIHKKQPQKSDQWEEGDSSSRNPNLHSSDLLELQKRKAKLLSMLDEIINHGVPDDTVTNAKKTIRGFFDLPMQEKKQYAQKPGSLEGYGQAFVTTDEQKLEWSDMLHLQVLPTEARKLSFWPQSPSEFREALSSYSEEMEKLALRLLGFMATGLGLEASEFEGDIEHGDYTMRINYYPPCPNPEKVIGLSAHTDSSAITLLLEFDETSGLQVSKDGHWVTVLPIPGAITVNIGNIMEVKSNGEVISPLHRAMVNKLKPRLSIVTFCYPRKKTMVAPCQALITEEKPAMFNPMSYEEFMDMYFSQKVVLAKILDALRLR